MTVGRGMGLARDEYSEEARPWQRVGWESASEMGDAGRW